MTDHEKLAREIEGLADTLSGAAYSADPWETKLPSAVATLHLAAAALREVGELRAANERLQKERDYAVRWGNTSLDSVKEVMWRYEEALETIRDRHVPDQPMADDSDEATYMRKHHTELRNIARRALEQKNG